VIYSYARFSAMGMPYATATSPCLLCEIYPAIYLCLLYVIETVTIGLVATTVIRPDEMQKLDRGPFQL
jgi:hypothetical protein